MILHNQYFMFMYKREFNYYFAFDFSFSYLNYLLLINSLSRIRYFVNVENIIDIHSGFS